MKTLSINMSKKEYATTLKAFLEKLTTETIVVSEKANRQVFMDQLEMFKPNEKDLHDESHHHYNPNAIMHLFMKDSMYKSLDVSSLKLKAKFEKIRKDGGRYWLPIEKQSDLEKLVKHLVSKGYHFNEVIEAPEEKEQA